MSDPILNSVTRYDLYFNPHGEDYIRRMEGGQFVSFSDLPALLEQAFGAGREYQQERLTNHDMHSGLACLTNYERGQRDALAKIEALRLATRQPAYALGLEAAIAVLKGGNDE